ncbi:hypothetical protein BJV74DRAFT_800152 [Russula compacta]|nr:hypothetical protein BJV74DRAFT_800152 [Russula compacta]
MGLQEELNEEAEECSIVRKQLDNEDVEMQPGDGEGKGASVGKLSEEDHKMDGEVKVAPKRKQQKEKAVRGETQTAVDKMKATLKATGKKKGVKPKTMRCM